MVYLPGKSQCLPGAYGKWALYVSEGDTMRNASVAIDCCSVCWRDLEGILYISFMHRIYIPPDVVSYPHSHYIRDLKNGKHSIQSLKRNTDVENPTMNTDQLI